MVGRFCASPPNTIGPDGIHAYFCSDRYKVHKLLIEAKASGISAAWELLKRFGRRPYAVQLCR